MVKQKAVRNPLKASVPKLTKEKGNSDSFLNVPKAVFSNNFLPNDPYSLISTGSDSVDSSDSESGTSDFQDVMQAFKASLSDPLYKFNKTVAALQDKQNQDGSKEPAGTNSSKAAPVFLKPLEAQKLRNSLLLADGGEEGYASGDVRYDPRTGKIEKRVKLETKLAGVPGDNSDTVDILIEMPDNFDFTGWDEKPAKQQQDELQKAGVSPEDQMVLLNSTTSLETLALIKEISDNRSEYGLSILEVERISKELLNISSARTGVNNHDLPLGINPITKNTFLAMLDEKEASLLASFGYGTTSREDLKNPDSNIGDQISDLLQGDQSISNLLHGDSDVYQAADQFFSDMGKLDSIISDINNGKIEFTSPQEKQRYLDYLSKAYKKNDKLYRQMLARNIDEAGLLQFPEWRLKQLVSDLSLTQLEGLVAQIEANGIKKLSRNGSFEKLMKELLSDSDSALNLVADETKSPICPYVWNGMDVAREDGVKISGYYFSEGEYHIQISCETDKNHIYNLNLGKTIPSEVAIEISRTTAWDMFAEQLELFDKIYLTPSVIADGAYYMYQYYGLPPFLPEGLSPSDVPLIGEFLERIDLLDHNTHLSKDTITIKIVTHHMNSSNKDMEMIQFNTINEKSEGN